MSLLQNSNAIEAGGYPISNSLRFQSASSQYATRTPAGAGTSNKIMTFSAWVKRGAFATLNGLFTGSGGTIDGIQFWNNNIDVFFNNGTSGRITTSAVYRDPSSWYHVVVAIDTTQANAADRVKIYINSIQVTSTTGGAPAQNYVFSWNQNVQQRFGTDGGSNFFDGYTAEVNVIDGQALTPSSFGETNTLTGQWVAKKYTGTYGTNGFYLPFSNGTSTTTLGADSSGNSNNWTLTNFTRSAGVSDCWMYDVPSGNGGVAGTQPNSNYAVMNPLWKGSQETIANGNLNVTSSGTGGSALSTIQMPSGKWYAEATINTGSDATIVGICDSTFLPTSTLTGSNSVGYYGNNGHKIVNGVDTAYGATYTTGDVIGIALDADAGTVTFYKNNASQGAITIGLSAPFLFATSDVSSTSNINQSWNFGQRSFAYTPPSGFKALCTANLPVATIKQGNKYMDATLYTGNGTSVTVTNAGAFKPDFIWLKSRSTVENNQNFDSVRFVGGAYKSLYSNLTNAEGTDNGVTAINSNGFTVGGATSNNNGTTYVGWQWQAGQGITSSNTNGSITSTVSVNATAGFSIVTYTGTGANATVGHGLGVAPKMVIVKDRTQANSWGVYHDAIGNTKILFLESTSAAQVTSTAWNNTSPTSTVFTIGTTGTTNQNTKGFVAYCFAEIAGFSRFGSYTGNGSADGPMIFTGFKPKFIMVKSSSAAATNWVIIDTARSNYNVADKLLFPNLSDAETVVTDADFLSNGFKVRGTVSGINSSGATYIYACFAENPMAQSNAV